MESLKMNEIDLLLIGKTGNGKSRTGNSILRSRKFKVSFNQCSETTNAAADWSEYDGRIIKIVDTPGVGDNRMDDEEGKRLVINAMKKAIAMNSKGYHAFLLVIQYGGRFTDEDEQTIKFLKDVFGKKFVRKYCILVMTRGDNFMRDAEDSGITFKAWCDKQVGVFKTLYNECHQRIVLFDNTSKDEFTQLRQLDNLISLIDSLWKPGHRYTDENFMKAAEAHERVLIEAKEPKISEETMRDISLLLQEKERINLKPLEERAEPLSKLLTKVDALFESINSQDKGTRALQNPMGTVDRFRVALKEEITFCKRLSEEIAKVKQESQREIDRLERRIKELETSSQAKDLQTIKNEEREREVLEKARQDERNKAERKILERQKAFERDSRERMEGIEESYQSARDETQIGMTEKVICAAGAPLKLAARGVDKVVSWIWG